ncbi:MAG: hypothetical protein SFY92_09490 [Verrucomicrobiae bacterium]|nr:hypothetical protein [Verrucomicrobiae bacterium]
MMPLVPCIILAVLLLFRQWLSIYWTTGFVVVVLLICLYRVTIRLRNPIVGKLDNGTFEILARPNNSFGLFNKEELISLNRENVKELTYLRPKIGDISGFESSLLSIRKVLFIKMNNGSIYYVRWFEDIANKEEVFKWFVNHGYTISL